jgi:hypothetical protein
VADGEPDGRVHRINLVGFDGGLGGGEQAEDHRTEGEELERTFHKEWIDCREMDEDSNAV